MAGAGSAPPIAPPPLQWPLVGRHDELDLFAASLADPRSHGFVIHGDAGVGKTRLADQCLAVASGSGRNVARATATEGSQHLPLGALAHLLPPGVGDERCDLVAIISQVRPVLLEQFTNGPSVLFVDDLHLLDNTSATLLGQLVDADLVFLLATVRRNEAMSPTLEALWHRARVTRIDLHDLDRAAVDTLLHLVLRAPVEASTITDIWSACQGNVLFIRESVLGALDAGQLVEQHGVWRLLGPLVATQRLRELVARRLEGLGAANEALDVLAVWEPIGIAALEEMTGRDQLEILDRAGLLAIRADGRRRRVTLTHPLYGEVLRDRMPALRRRRLLIELADRLETLGGRRREDATRIAAARLQALGSADPDLLLKAARLARYALDFPQVERFARAAAVHSTTPELGLLLGEALHEAGSYPEAEEVLNAAEDAAADRDPLLVYITELRTRNLMWGLLDTDAALALNSDVRRRLGDPAAKVELTLNEALLLAYGGQPRDALDVLEQVGDLTIPRLRALRAIAEVPALIAVGRPETAVEQARSAFAEQSQVPDQVAIPGPGVHVLMQIYGLVESGRLQAAMVMGTAAYDIATSTSAPADRIAWLAHQLGRCALHLGRPQTAKRWLSEARARSEEHGMVSARRLVLSLLATASAWLGDRDAASAAVDELDRLPMHPFVRSEQELGRAWAHAAAGDLGGARQVLQAGAELARRSGYRSSEAHLLHEIVRLGDPASVVDRLAELAAECEGALVHAYATHADALVREDAEALAEVVDRFEDIGALLLAAEAATEAAQAIQDAGHRRRSTAQGVRAAALAAECEGAQTPGLMMNVMVAPLTARERDVATLAAAGASSKAIADRLYLSVRTVNNHLQSAYSKLGISGRGELAAALERQPA